MIYDLPIERSSKPEGWRSKALRELADVIGGGTPDTGVDDFWTPPEIPWVTPTDITNCPTRVLTRTERAISQSGLKNCSASLLPTNSTLLTSRATIGECRMAGVPVATNQGFASLVPRDEQDASFVYYLAQWLKPVFARLAAGTTFVEVSRREVRRVRLCVPESEERAHIGQVLEKSDIALEAAGRQLDAAITLRTALMQSLFLSGLPGEHSTYQSGKVFRHEFKVPSDWHLEQLRNSITKIEYGSNTASNDEKRGLPIIAIPEVVASRFRLGECAYAEVSTDEAESLRLAPDDVLLVRTNGNPSYIGKSTVIGEEAEEQHIIFASYLIRIKADPGKLSGKYLNYFLASPLGRRQCIAMANTSAGNHNLSSRSLKQFCFPRPSPDEQKEIVGAVDVAEDAIESARLEVKRLESLRASLIDKLLAGHIRLRPEK